MVCLKVTHNQGLEIARELLNEQVIHCIRQIECNVEMFIVSSLRFLVFSSLRRVFPLCVEMNFVVIKFVERFGVESMQKQFLIRGIQERCSLGKVTSGFEDKKKALIEFNIQVETTILFLW